MLGTTTNYLAPNCSVTSVPSMVLKNPLFRLNNTPVSTCSSSSFQGGRTTYSMKASQGTLEAPTVTKSKPREALTVTKSKPVLVRPSKKTYDGLYYLSHLDELLMGPLDIFFPFETDGRRTDNLTETIKQALAEVLVYFYPFAGSLIRGPDGKFVVNCTGEGVSFVEAVADCELQEFGDFTIPNLPKYRQLVNAYREAKNPFDVPPLAVQVTRFQCGGFVLGIATNHCMCDGASLMAFVKSWAELARGLPLSVPPVLDRSILKPRQPWQPLKIEYNHDDSIISAMREDGQIFPRVHRDEQSIFKSFCFDSQKLMQLKKIAMEDGTTKCVTDFELIMAFIWCARTKALKMNPTEQSKLLIVIDVRRRFGPSIPKGYFGNAIFLMGCECNAGELIEKPLSFAVDLIKRAMELDCIQSFSDYREATRGDLVLDKGLIGNKWSRLPSNDIDFGWGGPKQLVNACPQNEIVVVHAQSIDSENKILTLGLSASDMKAFEEIMQSEMGMQACIEST